MADRDQLRAEARAVIMDHVTRAVAAAVDKLPDGDIALRAAPSVLAGLAGSFVLQFMRAGVLNDGETDHTLAQLALQMRQHADPELNPPTGHEMPRSHGARSRG